MYIISLTVHSDTKTPTSDRSDWSPNVAFFPLITIEGRLHLDHRVTRAIIIITSIFLRSMPVSKWVTVSSLLLPRQSTQHHSIIKFVVRTCFSWTIQRALLCWKQKTKTNSGFWKVLCYDNSSISRQNTHNNI